MVNRLFPFKKNFKCVFSKYFFFMRSCTFWKELLNQSLPNLTAYTLKKSEFFTALFFRYQITLRKQAFLQDFG